MPLPCPLTQLRPHQDGTGNLSNMGTDRAAKVPCAPARHSPQGHSALDKLWIREEAVLCKGADTTVSGHRLDSVPTLGQQGRGTSLGLGLCGSRHSTLHPTSQGTGPCRLCPRHQGSAATNQQCGREYAFHFEGLVLFRT